MKKITFENYGSLSSHRGFLGKPSKKGSVKPFPCSPAKVFARQASALAARLRAIFCRNIVLGLSGGLDSTLALLVVAEAFDRLDFPREGIHVVTMPGFASSKRTKNNADKLCRGLGLQYETIPIGSAVRSHLKAIGHDAKTTDITYENAQARMRTLVLMDKANLTDGIVVGTGDLSEIALGWCTYNGDHMSMFAVNNNVPKTVVRKVCRWWADEAFGRKALALAGEAVEDVLSTPVSPELVKGQVTEDKIGPYELHDFFLWNFIVNEMSPKELFSSAKKYFKGAFDDHAVRKTLSIFLRRFFSQAFKRNCQPDGVKVFPFELSLRGWNVPSDVMSRIPEKFFEV
jgi:NAD+ synthase (glutamine-hydrolysing)